MLVNVVDVPPLCNFILPAIVRTGPLAIAISTAGASPALAKRMKREIAELFGEDYAELAEILNDVRGWAKGTLPTYQDRKAFFEEKIANGVLEPDPASCLLASALSLDQLITPRASATASGSRPAEAGAAGLRNPRPALGRSASAGHTRRSRHPCGLRPICGHESDASSALSCDVAPCAVRTARRAVVWTLHYGLVV